MLTSSLPLLLASAPRLPANPIPAGCPWHELSQYGLPNVNWCEEYVCAWINEPANTWSNLAYVFAALWILGLRRGTGTAGPLRWFAPVLATMGLFSGIYHASNTHVTQILDFLGMYLFCFLLLGINGVRLRALSLVRLPLWFFCSVSVATVGTVLAVRAGFPIQSFIGILTLALVVTELLIRRRSSAEAGPTSSLRGFFASLGLLTLAASCSALDVSRTLCDPQNHFLQGHAAWHVLSAAALLAAYYHYRQFHAELSSTQS